MYYERLDKRQGRCSLPLSGLGAAAAAILLVSLGIFCLVPGSPSAAPSLRPSSLYALTATGNATAEAKVACLNPVVSTGSFRTDSPEEIAEGDRELQGWELVQVTDMQRHADRWLYRHDNIGNICWPGQLNSSNATLVEQCAYDRDSLWAHFPHEPDPYASPDEGSCNLMQITLSGLQHARELGKILAAEYAAGGKHPLRGLSTLGCRRGSVFLASDSVQKNERTIEEVYTGLCGWAPTLDEFPASEVLVNGTTAPGTPFWLRPGVCGGKALADYGREAAEALKGSQHWTGEVRRLAQEVSKLSGHPLPEDVADYRPFLSSIVDCAVCHACLGLDDAAGRLLNAEGFPDGAGLFGLLDRAETAGILWPFEYFRSRGEEDYLRYARLQYGYYFAVLVDRMQAAVDAIRRKATVPGPEIFIQVMSDTNLSPQLFMLGLKEEAAVRPQWLATLVTELWVRADETAEGGVDFAVRVLYNGRVQRPCPGQRGVLCPWREFRELLARLAPRRRECPAFYDNYKLASSFEP